MPAYSSRSCPISRPITGFKPSKQRMKLDEVGLFTVANGKIVREEFFYDMG